MCCQQLPDWAVSLIILGAMRVCMSVNFNAVRNIKMSDYAWDASTQMCTYRPHIEGEINPYQIPIYAVEFFLPALGGLLVDKWFGELKVLQASGIVLLISGVYVTVVENTGLMCHPAAFIIGLVPSCLAYGIGVAPLLAAPLKLSEAHLGSPTPGLLVFYAAASFGEFLGFIPRYIRVTVDLTWIVCISPLIYISMSYLLKLDWRVYHRRVQFLTDDSVSLGFSFPTLTRLRRYFLLLAPLVLLVSIIANVRATTYCLELDYYLNCTGNCTRVTCGEVFSCYNFSTLAVLSLLGVLYKLGYLALDGRTACRFYLGACVLFLSKAAFIAWHLWAASLTQLPDPGVTHAIYAAASALDGISNSLALASGYEMVYRISLANTKSFVMGLLFTVWSTGACVSAVTVILFTKYPRDFPVLAPVFGISNRLYAPYIVMAVESVLLMLYFYAINVNMVRSMMVVNSGQLIEDDVKYDETDQLSTTIQRSSRYGSCHYTL